MLAVPADDVRDLFCVCMRECLLAATANEMSCCDRLKHSHDLWSGMCPQSLAFRRVSAGARSAILIIQEDDVACLQSRARGFFGPLMLRKLNHFCFSSVIQAAVADILRPK